MLSEVADDRTVVEAALAGLFSVERQAAAKALASAARFEHVGEGSVLVSEGERADDLFVLCTGRLQVYVKGAHDELSAVAVIDHAGQVVGEQAFLGERNFRNATLIALRSSRIARIPGALFREQLDQDAAAVERLSKIGVKQLEHRLNALALELGGLVSDRGLNPVVTRQFDVGTPLFKAGDPANLAFLIIGGQIALTNPQSGKTEERVGRGLAVGVEEVRTGQPHGLHAYAIEPTEAVELHKDFVQQWRGSDALGEHVLRTGQFAPRTQSKHVALTSLRQEAGEACVTTDYLGQSGDVIRVKYYPSRRHTDALINTADASRGLTVKAPQGEGLLILDPDSGEIMGLSASANWSELPRAMDLLLDRRSLNALQQQALAEHGRLLAEDQSGEAPGPRGMICSCKAVIAIQLQDLAREGASVEDMIAQTGAGSVCGGCRDLLPLFTNTETETLCWIEPRPLPGGLVQVRLHYRPAEGGANTEAAQENPTRSVAVKPAQAGHFIRVSAMVDGQWLQRPYTLSNWDETSYEITVKLEERGQFSDWLRRAVAGDLVKVGAPEGHDYGSADDPRSLVFIVAGIGVTPALSAVNKLLGQRPIEVRYVYRDPATASGLEMLRARSNEGHLTLREFATAEQGGRPSVEDLTRDLEAVGPCQLVICGPELFNSKIRSVVEDRAGIETWVEDFRETISRRRRDGEVASIRVPGFVPDRARDSLITRKSPGTMEEEAEDFLREYYCHERPDDDPQPRFDAVGEAIANEGSWHKTADELAYAAQLAWRNAPRCIGRLHWRGLHLHDARDLREPDEMAQALFEHMRFSFNGGAVQPAITVFDPGSTARPAARIWNSQLQLYAGYRLRSGQQVGDPAQNALTAAIMALGWEPEGGDFEILPLVIQGGDGRAHLHELPEDCRREVALSHPGYPRLSSIGLRWHAVPYVSDMRLDAGGMNYPFAPFNGWFMNTEIAARNLTDRNRYNLLHQVGELMGLDRGSDRNLWRDKALIMLNEAVIGSFDQAGVRLADHHNVAQDFVEFCRTEQRAGREAFGEWMWLVPPVSASLAPFYQQPFANISVKPAYAPQRPIWKTDRGWKTD